MLLKRKATLPARTRSKRPKEQTFAPLHQVQLEVVERLEAVLATHGVAYLVAPPGSGKSALLRAVRLAPTAGEDDDDEQTTTVLNIVAVSTADLVKEMAGKMPLSLMPPFNGSKVESLKKLIAYPKVGTAVTIAVTHDFLRRKLNPPKNDLSNDLKAFLKAAGRPKTVRLMMDEAHNLTANMDWALRLGTAKKALLEKTTVQVLLVSGTPKLDVARFAAATKVMLGATAQTLPDMLVEYTADEVARFRADLCTLPPPATHPTLGALAAPFPNEALDGLLDGRLRSLAKLVVGDMLFLVQCEIDGKRRRREIHAVNAMRNLVAEILAIVAHHSAEGDPTGGAIFASLKAKVPTARVVDGALPSRSSKVGECVLVVHGAPRGLNKHAQLLNEMEPGADGIPDFSAHDLSSAEANLAIADRAHADYFEAFDTQTKTLIGPDGAAVKNADNSVAKVALKGPVHGLLLPKNLEGTDKYNERVTKVIVLGPTDKAAQIRGRFDRPETLVNGMRVRKCATEIVHLRSEWASAIFALERLDKGTSVLEAPMAILQRVNALAAANPSFAGETRDLVCKYATKLFLAEGAGDETKALLPGELVDLFFAQLCHDAARATFLAKGAADGYFSIVRKYARDEPDDDEPSTATSSDEIVAQLARDMGPSQPAEGGEDDDDEEEEGA